MSDVGGRGSLTVYRVFYMRESSHLQTYHYHDHYGHGVIAMAARAPAHELHFISFVQDIEKHSPADGYQICRAQRRPNAPRSIVSRCIEAGVLLESTLDSLALLFAAAARKSRRRIRWANMRLLKRSC